MIYCDKKLKLLRKKNFYFIKFSYKVRVLLLPEKETERKTVI
jgi:hypothetical protein